MSFSMNYYFVLKLFAVDKAMSGESIEKIIR